MAILKLYELVISFVILHGTSIVHSCPNDHVIRILYNYMKSALKIYISHVPVLLSLTSWMKKTCVTYLGDLEIIKIITKTIIFFLLFQVDSSERLAGLCGMTPGNGRPAECFCAIITRDPNASPNEDPPLSPSEQTLTDFYECTLEEFPRPVVRLAPVSWTSKNRG